MLLSYELLYASVGCNKSSNIVAWNKSGQIAYAFHNSIALYISYQSDVVNSGKIIQILNGHANEITFLNWDVESLGEILISASKDGTIILWLDNNQLKFQWHNQHVTSVSTKLINKHLLISSTSMDSTLHIALSNKQELIMSKSISLGYEIGLCLANTLLTSTEILMACGLTNGDIRLYLIAINISSQELDFKSALDIKEISTVLRGHLDWMRDLHFLKASSGKIYLLSCSQDCTIKIWTIAPRLAQNLETNQANGCFQAATETFKDQTGLEYEISLESTLHSHKNWVYSVKWHPSAADNESPDRMSFISASIDETCILWQYDPHSGLWLDQVRLGTIKGLGFYGACFSPDGQMVLANAINGSLYMWKKSETSKWNSYVMMTGHCGPVTDLCWAPRGQYLLTTSADQTTRLHAPWIDQNVKGSRRIERDGIWMELCRSQIHGYDMTALSALNAYTYASGAEEKIARIFKAPRNFINNYARWTGHSLLNEYEMNTVQIPDTASNNPLDLTNLSVYSSDNAMERQNIVAQAMALEDFPTENLLHQSTLWPEERKLYGHGYDIYSLAYNSVHKILASACKASKADFAEIFLWDCCTWKLLGKLAGHSLTVTRMQFSQDGIFLLTVSRDRTWIMYRKDGSTAVYDKVDELVGKNKAVSHSRIIWDCCFLQGNPFNYSFITVSRDKKAILWTPQDCKIEEKVSIWNSEKLNVLTPDCPITAVANIALHTQNGKDHCATYVVALGLESGAIKCYSLRLHQSSNANSPFTMLFQVPQSHSLSVKRLAFRPTLECDEIELNHSIILASGSEDYSIRLHKFNVDHGIV